MWVNSFANETSRLAQGVVTQIPSETNIIFFIIQGNFLSDRKVTYRINVAEIQPKKSETYCNELIIGRNLTNFTGDVTTLREYLTKIHVHRNFQLLARQYLQLLLEQ